MYCPKCGHKINDGEGQEYCDQCGQKLPYIESASLSGVSSHTETDTGRNNSPDTGSPWEDETSAGFFPALAMTVYQTLFQPAIFFRNMPRGRGQTLPVIYCLILGVAGAILGMVADSLAESPVMTHGSFVRQMAISSILLVPFLMITELYIGAVFLHLSMMIFGAAKENFATTIRVVSYSSSPNIFYVVPYFGWLLVAIWSFWITVVGIRVVGEVGLVRALITALAPTILLIILILAVALSLVGLIGIASFA